VGKLVSLYAFAYQSIVTDVAGDYSGSVSAAEGLNPANWFEPYKAPSIRAWAWPNRESSLPGRRSSRNR
jgi:hypothetical protein